MRTWKRRDLAKRQQISGRLRNDCSSVWAQSNVCKSHSSGKALCADALDTDWIYRSVLEHLRQEDSPEEARARLIANLQLAERLGSETTALTGDDIAETIAYAQQRSVTKDCHWQVRTRRVARFFRRQSVVDRLISDGEHPTSMSFEVRRNHFQRPAIP